MNYYNGGCVHKGRDYELSFSEGKGGPWADGEITARMG